MDPFSKYLLSVVKNEETNSTRRYMQCEDALHELGYWLMERPVQFSREEIRSNAIVEECELVDSFESRDGDFNFDITVDVYGEKRRWHYN